MKSNETLCMYCGSIIDLMKTKKRFFCCDDCRLKYYKGLNKGLWKEGDIAVNPDDKPNHIRSHKALKGVTRKG